MPQCKKCAKKGLFLKIEEDTGLCLSCTEAFSKKGKVLTEKVIQAKNNATTSRDPKAVALYCRQVEDYGTQLIGLHKEYNLQPSQELLDLIEVYRKRRESAEK